MIVLDQHMPLRSRDEMRRIGIRASVIGFDIGWSGMDDTQDILPLLQRTRQCTFFSRDLAFFARTLCHARYCLVVLDTSYAEMPLYIRRSLRHPHFRTRAQRAGVVARVSSAGIVYWQVHDMAMHEAGWPSRS